MLAINKIGKESLPEVAKLANKIWPVSYKNIITDDQIQYMLNLFYCEKALIEQIDLLNHQFIIITENQSPVGFASYSPKFQNSTTIFRLHKLYVDTSCKRKGYGKMLVNFIIEDVNRLSGKFIELNVNKNNPAKDFYLKLGFTIIDEEDIDIGSGFFMNDFIMRLAI